VAKIEGEGGEDVPVTRATLPARDGITSSEMCSDVMVYEMRLRAFLFSL